MGRKSKEASSEAQPGNLSKAKPKAKRSKQTKVTSEGSEMGVIFRPVSKSAPDTLQPTEKAKPRKPIVKKPTPVKTAKIRGQKRNTQRQAIPKTQVPKRKVRERILTPPGAPRVQVINGRPTLVVSGKAVPPPFFFGSCPDENRAKVVLEEISKAASAGVHVHSLMVEFRVDQDGAQQALDLSAYLLKKVLEVDPSALVMFRLVFAGPAGWEKKYPSATYRYADGTSAEPSFCDDQFWGDAARLLSGYVKALRELDDSSHIIGLHLDRGEWFFAEGWGYDTSRAAEEAFREWALLRYNGDRVLLQSAWFDGSAQFETLRIPDYNEYPLSGEGFLRARRKERKWVDYHLFMSDAIVERIQELAWHVKKASQGWFLVAVSYGYTFEWSHPASGHLALGKLLRTKEVDLIGGPPSYKDRGLGGTSPFPGPIDSFALNGKLFVSEEDFKTPISKVAEPDEFNPPMQTPQALEAAHWRGVGSALAHSAGVVWMDLWGNGWLNTPAIWSRAAKVREVFVKALSMEERDPDVAVLIDERSLAYLSDARAFRQLVQDSREAVLRAGVSAGFYLLTDLAHRKRFPEAKLYVLLNAWDLRPEVRDAIKTRLQKAGKTLFWVYSAGQFEAGRPALERVREVTGIAIRPQPFNSRAGTTILNRKHPLTELLEERALSVVDQLEPSYFAIPEDGTTVLGEYTGTGLPSFVVREIPAEDGNGTWRSVFLGEPLISEKIIRGLCALANVHVWNYHGDVVHARQPILSIHYSGSGHRIATLPDRYHAYDPLKEKWIGADATHLRSEATDGASQLLFVGEEADIHALASLEAEAFLNNLVVPEPEDETDDSPMSEDIGSPLPIVREFADIYAEQEDTVKSSDTPSTEKKRRTARKSTKKLKVDADAGIGVVFRNKE